MKYETPIHCDICNLYPATHEVENAPGQPVEFIPVCSKGCEDRARERMNTDNAKKVKCKIPTCRVLTRKNCVGCGEPICPHHCKGWNSNTQCCFKCRMKTRLIK